MSFKPEQLLVVSSRKNHRKNLFVLLMLAIKPSVEYKWHLENYLEEWHLAKYFGNLLCKVLGAHSAALGVFRQGLAEEQNSPCITRHRSCFGHKLLAIKYLL